MDWYDHIVHAASSASDDGEKWLLFRLTEVKRQMPKRSGSRPGRRPNVNRNFRFGHEKLLQDYFSETPTYDDNHFLRRFRIPRAMFLDIMQELESSDDYFQLRCDATGKVGLSSLQKCTAALRMLAYGASASSLDENLRIGESTSLLTLRNFCKAVLNIYGPEYLRAPAPEEVNKLMHQNAVRGFPGMVGSVDCMHWVWKNCPVTFKGQYQGKEGKSTIVLEAVASRDLYIWHAFFGCP
ncbi:uncharacterized protein LOC129718718 [Wyeomyia smithii]|uniref:uncharacterized protein LOC129718718 n=1 Tax=Wyeomyia smithii TaxID=174621 RepID=UPI002467C38B|nr:uncharacterized protein LOC129718718 [Wyeomyia smithii]